MSRKGETGTAAGLGYRLAPGGPIFSFIAQMSLKTLASILPLKAVWDLNWCMSELYRVFIGNMVVTYILHVCKIGC